MAIISLTRTPNIPIIAPLLLTTIRRTQIASAVTAIIHAVDTLLTIISSSLTELHPLQAVDKFPAILPQAAENKDLAAREELRSASLFARIAFFHVSPGSEYPPAHGLLPLCEEVW